jgi:hypothetical protein
MTLHRIIATLIATLLALSLAPAGHADCSCQCVEGVARTLCTHIDEAARRPATCGDTAPVCPPPATPADVERYDPPPGASHCRSARILDRETGAYSLTARLCDVADADASQPPAR